MSCRRRVLPERRQCLYFLIAMLILLFLTLLIWLLGGKNCDQKVSTSLGSIKGSTMKTRLGRTIMAFRGIRYAKAPVNDLRLRPPVRVDPWRRSFDATEEGPICPQPEEKENVLTSEDCLRLNVYTPQYSDVPCWTSTVLMPVFAYIGGVGLMEGGSLSKTEGPANLLDRNVVLVTINYRLGPLGFMSTGTADQPGNNGFKDQVMALQWIQEHIQHFGGDPNQVTLFGWSGGALSAMLHMVSPMSSGLFSKVIMMSGSVPGQIKIPEEQLYLAVKQAELVGCPHRNIKLMLKCLRKIDGKKIANTTYDFREYDVNPWYIWLPVVEPDFGQERFLTENPGKLFKAGNFTKVPVIIGMTKQDIISPVPYIWEDEARRMGWNSTLNFHPRAPICFMYNRDMSNVANKEWSQKFYDKNFVYGGNLGEIKAEDYEIMINMFTEAVIGFGVKRFIEWTHKVTDVYFYINSFLGKYNEYCFIFREKIRYFTAHGEDKLFFLSDSSRPFEPDDTSAKHMEEVLDLWVNFTYYGDPNGINQESNTTWAPYKADKHNVLSISNEIGAYNETPEQYQKKFEVWDRYPDLEPK